MGRPAAKQGDRVVATDTHVVLVAGPTGPVPTPMPMAFDGRLSDGLSDVTFMDDLPAATVGSEARNLPPHVPTGGSFQSPPSNRGKIVVGSETVFIGDQRAARHGDAAETCNDPVDAPVGKVIAASKIIVG